MLTHLQFRKQSSEEITFEFLTLRCTFNYNMAHNMLPVLVEALDL